MLSLLFLFLAVIGASVVLVFFGLALVLWILPDATTDRTLGLGMLKTEE